MLLLIGLDCGAGKFPAIIYLLLITYCLEISQFYRVVKGLPACGDIPDKAT